MLPAKGSAEGLLRAESIDICGPVLNTGAAEVMRQHFMDVLEFVIDFNSLTKIKVSRLFSKILVLCTIFRVFTNFNFADKL